MYTPFEIENMKMGVSTAATQIDGGKCDSNWEEFAKTEGNVLDGSSPDPAVGHWDRYQEDTQLMQDMNIEIYRFGIEWAKIQPTRDTVSAEAVEHYRREIILMQEKGISPLLTIHHFSHPMWFENMGGFCSDKAVEVFSEFVQIVLDSFGDLVSDYITINEPNVFAVNSYFYGVWYPKKKNFALVKKVYHNMVKCHIASYRQIHEYRSGKGYSNTKVGFANHLRVFDPKNAKNPIHRFFAKFSEKLFQDSLTKAMMVGECSFPVPKKGIEKGKYYDFIGINYYTRSTCSGLADGVREGCETNDLGWEIYPEGLIRIAKDLYAKYQSPIWVTENGTADGADAFRTRFIYDQLKAMAESGLPFERYYHWSFSDNWEWAEGATGKFGLVAIDYETLQRTVRNSGKFYAEVIASHGVTKELIEKYLK